MEVLYHVFTSRPLCPRRDSNPGRPSHSLVTILTKQCRLSVPKANPRTMGSALPTSSSSRFTPMKKVVSTYLIWWCGVRTDRPSRKQNLTRPGIEFRSTCSRIHFYFTTLVESHGSLRWELEDECELNANFGQFTHWATLPQLKRPLGAEESVINFFHTPNETSRPETSAISALNNFSVKKLIKLQLFFCLFKLTVAYH
jgi:hypothetical protein